MSKSSKKYSQAKEFLIIIGKSKSLLHGLAASDFSPTLDNDFCHHFKCTFCILGIFSKSGQLISPTDNAYLFNANIVIE